MSRQGAQERRAAVAAAAAAADAAGEAEGTMTPLSQAEHEGSLRRMAALCFGVLAVALLAWLASGDAQMALQQALTQRRPRPGPA